MFRGITIVAAALCAGCQSLVDAPACLDKGHIYSIEKDIVSFCTDAELQQGAHVSITVGFTQPGRGHRSSWRRTVGYGTVIGSSAEGIARARVDSGYARVGAHAQP